MSDESQSRPPSSGSSSSRICTSWEGRPAAHSLRQGVRARVRLVAELGLPDEAHDRVEPICTLQVTQSRCFKRLCRVPGRLIELQRRDKSPGNKGSKQQWLLAEVCVAGPGERRMRYIDAGHVYERLYYFDKALPRERILERPMIVLRQYEIFGPDQGGDVDQYRIALPADVH